MEKNTYQEGKSRNIQFRAKSSGIKLFIEMPFSNDEKNIDSTADSETEILVKIF